MFIRLPFKMRVLMGYILPDCCFKDKLYFSPCKSAHRTNMSLETIKQKYLLKKVEACYSVRHNRVNRPNLITGGLLVCKQRLIYKNRHTHIITPKCYSIMNLVRISRAM